MATASAPSAVGLATETDEYGAVADKQTDTVAVTSQRKQRTLAVPLWQATTNNVMIFSMSWGRFVQPIFSLFSLQLILQASVQSGNLMHIEMRVLD
jgi:hypothetical protein